MQSKYTPLGFLGLIFISIGLLVWAIVTELSPYSVTPLVLGGCLVLAYVLMNIGYLTHKLTKRTAVAGANMAVGVVIVLAIIVFLQMILAKHSMRYDMTETKKFSLASQTIQLLKSLDDEFTFQYLSNPSSPSAAGETQVAKDLMELYSLYTSKITINIIDPDKEPEKVQDLSPITPNSIYIRKGDQKITPVNVTPINENTLTNAIMKLVNGGQKVIYFVSGHNERILTDITNRDAMGGMTKLLEQEGYTVKELKLTTIKEVPSDAVAVIIAGPQLPYYETEISTIDNYLQYGGRMIVMLDPENTSGLEKFFNESYGVEFGDNYVVEQNPLMQMFGQGSPLSPTIGAVEAHPIIDAFKNGIRPIPFPVARSLKKSEELPEGVEATEFIKTSNQAFGETDIAGLKTTHKAQFDQGVDVIGPITLGIALTKPAEEKVSEATSVEVTETTTEDTDSEKVEEKPETRLVVFGDSDFATNKVIQNSYDLFINSVNWITNQEDLISIRPKDDSGQPIMISQVDARFVFYTSLVILPLLIAIIGIVIISRKRFQG
jgi:gliding motility-associatede transport system auxiliary component